MIVKLLYYTENPDFIVSLAARQGWTSKGVDEVKCELTKERTKKLIRKLYKKGHLSPFEHANFTFLVEGISRVTSHQLVRHRIASYTQQSQRHVRVEREEFVVPDSIKGNEEALKTFNEAVQKTVKAYSKLISLGIPLEDARYIIPSAAKTRVFITMNARTLLNFFRLRLCSAAQWEIRKMAEKMLEEVKKVAPLLFEHAGPPCINGNCPEGKVCELFQKYYRGRRN